MNPLNLDLDSERRAYCAGYETAEREYSAIVVQRNARIAQLEAALASALRTCDALHVDLDNALDDRDFWKSEAVSNADDIDGLTDKLEYQDAKLRDIVEIIDTPNPE